MKKFAMFAVLAVCAVSFGCGSGEDIPVVDGSPGDAKPAATADETPAAEADE